MLQARYLTAVKPEILLGSSCGRCEHPGVLPKCSQVLDITHGGFQSSCKGHVHVEAHTCSTAHLRRARKTLRLKGNASWLGGQRDRAVTPPHLIRRSAAREEVAIIVAVQRNVENTGVCVERLLGAVAMMNILMVTQHNRTHQGKSAHRNLKCFS